jgi:phosphatidylserine decarboxylase
MIASTVVLGAAAILLGKLYLPAIAVPIIIWIWSIAFFRDPRRKAQFDPGVLCAAADGRVKDITRLERYGPIDAPAVRIGVFLSLFDVHANRWPCSGTVRSVDYAKGKFLTAMDSRAGEQNESNTIVIDPAEPVPGPVVVRQVAGIAARRIVCHAQPGTKCSIGERFGMIKFGSRTELIVPEQAGTEVVVQVGDKVEAGITPLVRQLRGATDGSPNVQSPQDDRRPATTAP